MGPDILVWRIGLLLVILLGAAISVVLVGYFLKRGTKGESTPALFRELNASDLSSLKQKGLLTDEEEAWAPGNVGGNCVIRRELWEKGLRYNETPWPELEPGFSEDSYLSPLVLELGYKWGRVQRTCIDGISTADPKDPYYKNTYKDRNISHILKGIKT